MPSCRPVNRQILCVGAGYWGSKLVAAVHNSSPGARITVVDPSNTARSSVLHLATRTLSDYRPVKADLVLVAVPSNLQNSVVHRLMTHLMANQTAPSALLLTKPISVNSDTCKAWESWSGYPPLLEHTFLAHPGYIALLRLLRQHKEWAVQAHRWNTTAPRDPMPALAELGVHDAYLMRAAVGGDLVDCNVTSSSQLSADFTLTAGERTWSASVAFKAPAHRRDLRAELPAGSPLQLVEAANSWIILKNGQVIESGSMSPTPLEREMIAIASGERALFDNCYDAAIDLNTLLIAAKRQDVK